MEGRWGNKGCNDKELVLSCPNNQDGSNDYWGELKGVNAIF